MYNTDCMKVGMYFNKKYFTETDLYREKINSVFGEGCKIVTAISDLDGLDVLFVFGGDGTILSVATQCAVRGVKIIGINYGHVGFLTEFEPDKFDDALMLVNGGNYKIQSRNTLQIEYGGNVFYALNDLVIQRNTSGKNFRNTVNLRAEIDGATVDNFSSDGIVVSTSTGSTAYSLAAGGSVLTPDIEAFILTPICPHSLHSRPVVFSDKSVLTIKSLNEGKSLGLIVDGKEAGNLTGGEIIRISKSPYTVDFISREDKNFFNKLLLKLNIWSK